MPLFGWRSIPCVEDLLHLFAGFFRHKLDFRSLLYLLLPILVDQDTSIWMGVDSLLRLSIRHFRHNRSIFYPRLLALIDGWDTSNISVLDRSPWLAFMNCCMCLLFSFRLGWLICWLYLTLRFLLFGCKWLAFTKVSFSQDHVKFQSHTVAWLFSTLRWDGVMAFSIW